MGSSSTCKVAGYWYSAGMHLVFCTGLDELLSIVVEEKTLWVANAQTNTVAWESDPYCYDADAGIRQPYNGSSCPSGTDYVANWGIVNKVITAPSVTDNTTLTISQKNLFGGQDREGGIEGQLDVEFGKNTQGKNVYLAAKQGADIPAYRGVFALVAKGMTLTCNTPQIKPWGVRGRRCVTGWRSDIDRIGDDMNPAHILCECLFAGTPWGGIGFPTTKRGASFSEVADALYDEEFGLSFLWSKNTDLDAFIKTVLKHIDGTIYQNYNTGKLELKLLRDDHQDIGSLPHYNKSNIISFESYDIKSTAELINTITIKYTDSTNGGDQSVTITDLSAVDRAHGDVISMEKEYFGATKSDLANKIGNRDLRAGILPVSTAAFVVNKDAYNTQPGDVIVVDWEPNGIENAVMIVGSIDLGTLDSSVVRLNCVLDVFSFGSSSFVEPPGSDNWTDPLNDPKDITVFTARELTYWHLATRNKPLFDEADTDDGTYLHLVAKNPSPDSKYFELWDNIPGEADYVIRANGSFSEYYEVSGPASSSIPAENQSDLYLSEPIPFNTIASGGISIGDLAYLGEEIVGFMAINETLDVITVQRGLIDTTPVTHPANTTIQFISSAKTVTDKQEFAATETVNFKMVETTSNGTLHIDNATEQSYTFLGRLGRPYPPGNMKINDESYPTAVEISGDSPSDQMDDDFTATDGTAPASSRWEAYSLNPSSVTVQRNAVYSNSLCVDATADGSTMARVGYGHVFTLGGDCGIQLDYSNYSSDDSTKGYLVFNFFDVTIAVRPSDINVYDGSWDTGITRTETYGSLKAERISGVLKFYVKQGTATTWTQVGGDISNTEDYGEIYIWTEVDDNSAVTATFDNFEYLSGDVKDQDGKAAGKAFDLTFSHRDRTQQVGDTPNPQTSGDIGPETGVTYNITCIDEDTSTAFYTKTGETDTSFVVSVPDAADNARVEVESVRDSQVSHTKNLCSFSIIRV